MQRRNLPSFIRGHAVFHGSLLFLVEIVDGRQHLQDPTKPIKTKDAYS